MNPSILSFETITVLKKISLWSIVLSAIFTAPIFGQKEQRSFTVKYISETIVTDGILDEGIWTTAESAN